MILVVVDPGEPGHRDEFGAGNLAPQFLDRLQLREEAVASDIEAEAFLLRGPGNAAHDLVGFQNCNPGNPLLREHVSRRQTGRSGAHDDHSVACCELSDRSGTTRRWPHLAPKRLLWETPYYSPSGSGSQFG